SGRMDGVTIALRAGAASALLEIPAGELTDNAEHLDELWQGEGARVLERLAEAPNDGARVQVVQHALDCASNVETAPPTEPHAVRLCSYRRREGASRTRQVAEAIGVDERRLRQLFLPHVGPTARAFRRLARMHAGLQALRRNPHASW